MDYLVFLLVYGATANVILSQASARLASIGVNFPLARQAVFRSQQPVARAFGKFVLLVITTGVISYCLIQTATYAFGWNVVASKMASELLIYLANFAIQRDLIFGDTAESSRLDVVEEEPARPQAVAPAKRRERSSPQSAETQSGKRGEGEKVRRGEGEKGRRGEGEKEGHEQVMLQHNIFAGPIFRYTEA